MSVLPEVAPSYRRLFSIEGFPRLVSGMLLARTSNTMVSLVLVLFALERFHSATIAGLVAFLSLAPGLLLSPIAGALLDRHGRTRLMVVDYIVAAAVTAPLRDPLGVVPHGGLIGDAWAGLVYVARHPTLRGLGISVSTANIGGGLFYIGLPVLVLLRLGGDAARVGQLFALQGVTAAFSGLFVGRYGTVGRERQLMAGSMLIMAVGYLVTLVSGNLLVIAVAMLVLGLASGPFDVELFTLR